MSGTRHGFVAWKKTNAGSHQGTLLDLLVPTMALVCQGGTRSIPHPKKLPTAVTNWDQVSFQTSKLVMSPAPTQALSLVKSIVLSKST